MKTAILFGSTGLVGGLLLNLLIKDENYKKIKIFNRSPIEISNPKIEIIQTDFAKLENFKNQMVGDECFFCIGTTKKKTPSKQDLSLIHISEPTRPY